MSAWQVYLWLKLDIIVQISFIFGSFLLLISIILFIFSQESHTSGEDSRILFKYFKYTAIAGGIFLILGASVPSTKQATIIYVLPKIANNEKLKQTSIEELKLVKKTINTWLEKQIKENSEILERRK